jgi:hypothetical protein
MRRSWSKVVPNVGLARELKQEELIMADSLEQAIAEALDKQADAAAGGSTDQRQADYEAAVRARARSEREAEEALRTTNQEGNPQ